MPSDSHDLDQRPGIPPETRIIRGVTVVIMPVAFDRATLAGARLVLRCEPDGRVYAAISRPSPDSAV
jgi:hypothetical protein